MMVFMVPTLVFSMEDSGQKFFEQKYLAAYIAQKRVSHSVFGKPDSATKRRAEQLLELHRADKAIWAEELMRIYPNTYRINLLGHLEKNVPAVGFGGVREQPFTEVVVLEKTVSDCATCCCA